MNLSMNNPFESIRKLALSKLSQFKFIMTIVMYLAAVIPLLSLGYLMGKTTPESSKWLLDLSSLLGSIGSLLGGLATVFAAWVAFGAYGAWKKQITHPEMFQNDMYILKELNEINDFFNLFIVNVGRDLFEQLNNYQDEVSGDLVKVKVKVDCNRKIKIPSLFDSDSFSLFAKYDRIIDHYNSMLVSLGYSSRLKNKIDKLYETSLSLIENPRNPQRVLIVKYLLLCNELYFIFNKCRCLKHFGTGNIKEMTFHSRYFSKDIIIVNAIDIEYGDYYFELDKSLSEIKESYRKKWDL